MPCSGSRKNWRNFWKKKTLTVQKVCDIIYRLISHQTFAAMAQSVERRLGKAEVTGSSPVSSLKASQSLGRFFLWASKHVMQEWVFLRCIYKNTRKEICFSGKIICFPQKYFFCGNGFTFEPRCVSMIKIKQTKNKK